MVPNVPKNEIIYIRILIAIHEPVLILPASSLCLGKLFNNIALPISIVFAPSLTIIQSVNKKIP